MPLANRTLETQTAHLQTGQRHRPHAPRCQRRQRPKRQEHTSIPQGRRQPPQLPHHPPPLASCGAHCRCCCARLASPLLLPLSPPPSSAPPVSRPRGSRMSPSPSPWCSRRCTEAERYRKQRPQNMHPLPLLLRHPHPRCPPTQAARPAIVKGRDSCPLPLSPGPGPSLSAPEVAAAAAEGAARRASTTPIRRASVGRASQRSAAPSMPPCQLSTPCCV